MTPKYTIPTILIVEDNDFLRSYMVTNLEDTGFFTEAASSGSQARDMLNRETYDMILLDLNLGDIHGLEILKQIRKSQKKVPIMIITAEKDIQTKLTSFELEADDYITKPFDIRELTARVKHFTSFYLKKEKTPAITQGPFYLDPENQKVTKNNCPLNIQGKPFELLHFLMKQPQQIFTKKILSSIIWEKDENDIENVLYVHMHKLRNSLEENPKKPKHLITVRGKGYKFIP